MNLYLLNVNITNIFYQNQEKTYSKVTHNRSFLLSITPRQLVYLNSASFAMKIIRKGKVLNKNYLLDSFLFIHPNFISYWFPKKETLSQQLRIFHFSLGIIRSYKRVE